MEITQEEGRIILNLLIQESQVRKITKEESELVFRITYHDKELHQAVIDMKAKESTKELYESITSLINQGLFA